MQNRMGNTINANTHKRTHEHTHIHQHVRRTRSRICWLKNLHAATTAADVGRRCLPAFPNYSKRLCRRCVVDGYDNRLTRQNTWSAHSPASFSHVHLFIFFSKSIRLDSTEHMHTSTHYTLSFPLSCARLIEMRYLLPAVCDVCLPSCDEIAAVDIPTDQVV